MPQEFEEKQVDVAASCRKYLRRVACLALVQGLCAIAAPGGTALAGWEERFAQPPADARILKIIHNWPDQPEAQDQLIGRLRAQGFGGVVCNVSFDQYLESDAKWLAFTRAVNEAKKAGMALWLYDERGYPSGNAGGITLRDHPEWEARGLLVADAESQGGPSRWSFRRANWCWRGHFRFATATSTWRRRWTSRPRSATAN